MSAAHFTTAFTVDQSPEEAFRAIQNVRGWWSESVVGDTQALGDVFVYRYEKLHVSTQTLTELKPGKKLVWAVSDAVLSFVKDKTEWNGTQLVFALSRKAGKTQVRFTHEGLSTAVECYGACSSAWTHYVNGSLKKLITTGRGTPDRKKRKVRKPTVKASQPRG
jgi:hypothetical protein